MVFRCKSIKQPPPLWLLSVALSGYTFTQIINIKRHMYSILVYRYDYWTDLQNQLHFFIKNQISPSLWPNLLLIQHRFFPDDSENIFITVTIYFYHQWAAQKSMECWGFLFISRWKFPERASDQPSRVQCRRFSVFSVQMLFHSVSLPSCLWCFWV